MLNTEAELIAAREFAEVFFEKIIKWFRAKGRTEQEKFPEAKEGSCLGHPLACLC